MLIGSVSTPLIDQRSVESDLQQLSVSREAQYKSVSLALCAQGKRFRGCAFVTTHTMGTEGLTRHHPIASALAALDADGAGREVEVRPVYRDLHQIDAVSPREGVHPVVLHREEDKCNRQGNATLILTVELTEWLEQIRTIRKCETRERERRLAFGERGDRGPEGNGACVMCACVCVRVVSVTGATYALVLAPDDGGLRDQRRGHVPVEAVRQ